jgi:hypothetical protein
MTEPTPHLTEDQLQGHLDSTLDPGLADQVKSHLEICHSCRESLEGLEKLSYRLGSLPDLELSRDLSDLVVSRLRQERALTPVITWTLVVEALGTGIVLAALIPVIQAAGWLPRLLYTGREFQVGLNIFLTQLASTWLVWWAELRLQVSSLGQALLPPGSLLGLGLSPWILIGGAGSLGILANYLLLGRQALPGRKPQAHN